MRRTASFSIILRASLLSTLLIFLPPFALTAGSGLQARNDQLSFRLTKRIPRPRGQVLAIILSNDDRLLVPATWEKKTELWDVETGRLIATVDGRVLRPYDYSDFKLLDAFSPDGKTLVTTTGKELKLWDTATGKLKLVLKGHTRDIRSQAFSPDGTTIATGSIDGTVKLWNAGTGELKSTLDAFKVKTYPRWRVVSRRISADLAEIFVSFSPDGAKILTAPYGQATKLWNARTGQREAVLSDQDFNGKFSPSGRFMLTMRKDSAETDLRETATGKVKATFTIGPAAFSSDEQWLGLVEHNGRKGLLNLNTMEVERQLPLDVYDFVTWTGFSPDNRVFVQASGLNQHSATLIDVSSGKTIAELPIVAKQGFDFISNYLKYWEKLSFHPRGRVLMGANQELVRFWDAKTGGPLMTLNEARDPAAFSHNGKLLITTDKDKKSLSLWEVVKQP